MKATRICLMAILFVMLCNAGYGQQNTMNKEKEYEVAVYYFLNYHPDSINSRWHGRDWTV